MIAAPSRTYINRIIEECDSDYSELPFSFNPEEQTPETLQECGYQLEFLGVSNLNDDGSQVEDDISVDITFFRSGYQCETEEHQTFIDKIYCIKNALVNCNNYDSGIKKVSIPTLSIEQLDTADNVMVIKLQTLVKYSFCF